MSSKKLSRGRASRSTSASLIKRGSKGRKGSSGSSEFHHDGSIVGLICQNGYEIDSSNGDGNCLFRSLSTGLTGQESYHLLFRNVIVAELSRAIPKSIKLEKEREIEEKEAERSKKSGQNGKKGSSSTSSDTPGVDEPEIIGSRSRKGMSSVAQRKAKMICNGAELIHDDLHIPDYHYFVLGDFTDYCQKMSTQSVWGGHLEIQAASNITGCKIVVLQDKYPPILVNPDKGLWAEEPTISLYLIYRGSCHYDAVLPDDSRREDFGALTSHAKAQEETTMERYGKVLKGIPIDFSLVEPIKKSWWLSSEGTAQSRGIGTSSNSNKNSKSDNNGWDSQDDDYGEEDGENDENCENEGVLSENGAKRVARHGNCDCNTVPHTPECSGPHDEGDAERGSENDDDGLKGKDGKSGKKSRKSGKSSSSSSSSSSTSSSPIPSIQFKFNNSNQATKTNTIPLDLSNSFEAFMMVDSNEDNNKAMMDESQTTNLVPNSINKNLSINENQTTNSLDQSPQIHENQAITNTSVISLSDEFSKLSIDTKTIESNINDVSITTNTSQNTITNEDTQPPQLTITMNDDTGIKSNTTTLDNDDVDYVPKIVFVWEEKKKASKKINTKKKTSSKRKK